MYQENIITFEGARTGTAVALYCISPARAATAVPGLASL